MVWITLQSCFLLASIVIGFIPLVDLAVPERQFRIEVIVPLSVCLDIPERAFIDRHRSHINVRMNDSDGTVIEFKNDLPGVKGRSK